MAKKKNDKLCNMCGKPMFLSINTGGIEATVTGGYDSTPGNGDGCLDDMTEYKFNICEFCLDFLFQNFKIPVEQYDLIDHVSSKWRPAAVRVEQDEWRRLKKEFFKMKNKRDASRLLKSSKKETK